MYAKELSNNEFLYDLLSVSLLYVDMYTYFITCTYNLLHKNSSGTKRL